MSARASEAPLAKGEPALREELPAFLQLLGLSALAITQPVLDVMGKSPETFVFRRAGVPEIVAFAVLLALVPALALTLIGSATRPLGSRARTAVHTATVLLLITALAIQIIKRVTPLSNVPVVVAGLTAASLLTLAILRVRGAGVWLRWAALAAPASLLIFLFVSPTSKLILGNRSGIRAGGAAPTPVVMMLFDQLPLQSLIDSRRRINPTLFPNFAELAAESTWYRNYTATEPHTEFAVPTMLSGRSATDRSKAALAADYPDNLFSLLSGTHRLDVFETVTRLCPGDCGGTTSIGAANEAGFGGLFRDAWRVWRALSSPAEVTGDVTTQFVEEAAPAPTPAVGSPAPEGAEGDRRHRSIGSHRPFLLSFRRGEPPTLHYLHLMLPHVPWRYFPSGAEYQTLGGARDDLPLVRGGLPWSWVEDSWAVQLARERHLLQVQYVDRLLGQALNRMRQTGIYDEALIIVTSDHGMSLQPGRSRGPTQENMHELYWVPLLIKQPHQQRGVVDDRNLMAPDLLPTIADSVDAVVPWRTDGRTALDEKYDRGPVKSIVRRPEERVPWPQKTLSISTEEAWRRLTREAFVPPGNCHWTRCFYYTGPRAGLIGSGVNGYTIGEPSGRTATLDLPRGLGGRQKETALPALVWGVLDGASPTEDPLIAAIARGRIAGVSTTWVQDGVEGRFGMVIPEFLLRDRDRGLRLYIMEGRTLHPLGIRFP